MSKKEKSIYKQMKIVNIWFHFTRNNPRNREYFYNLLIDKVGAENWKYLGSEKTSWEEARTDFDMLYSLIKTWSRKGIKTGQKDKPTAEDVFIEKLKNTAGIKAEEDSKKAADNNDDEKDREKKALEEFKKEKTEKERENFLLSLELEKAELEKKINDLK